MPRMAALMAVGLLVTLAGCSESGKSGPDDVLRSDIQLRTEQFLFDHPAEAAEVRAMCEQWKGSQRPMTTWPSVVTQNCNNEGAAQYRHQERQEMDKMKRQMGI